MVLCGKKQSSPGKTLWLTPCRLLQLKVAASTCPETSLRHRKAASSSLRLLPRYPSPRPRPSPAALHELVFRVCPHGAVAVARFRWGLSHSIDLISWPFLPPSTPTLPFGHRRPYPRHASVLPPASSPCRVAHVSSATAMISGLRPQPCRHATGVAIVCRYQT